MKKNTKIIKRGTRSKTGRMLCNYCLINKRLKEFPKTGRKCLECKNALARKTYHELPMDGMRICKKCHIEKPINLFMKGKSQCNSCRSIARRKPSTKPIPKFGMKICNICGLEDVIALFSKDRNQCLECTRAYDRARYPKEREQRIESATVYRKNRRENDPIFAIRCDIARMIGLYIDKDGISCLPHLPWTLEELKLYFEFKFSAPENLTPDGKVWMTWENRGRYITTGPNAWKDDDITTWCWNLDHIIPQAAFNYDSMEDEEFKQCWSLSNLRPLSAKQNISEGARGTKFRKVI